MEFNRYNSLELDFEDIVERNKYEKRCQIEFPIYRVSLRCPHTDQCYTVAVGCNTDDDKYGETFFSFCGFDNDSNQLKDISLFLDGGCEREILIALLKTAIEILETKKLTISIKE